MSIQDLQNSLKRVAEQAREFEDQLSKFKSSNDEDLTDARNILVGTTTGTDGVVASALGEASQALEDAKRAMADAAEAADSYARKI